MILPKTLYQCMASFKPSSNACFRFVHTKIGGERKEPRLEQKKPFLPAGGGGAALSSWPFFAYTLPGVGAGRIHCSGS